MARQLIKHGSQSLVIILMMLGILFFANILSARFFYRADLTENKEFTITEATKKILTGIDDIVNIKLYFSKDLPPYLSNLETQVKDLLDEYQAFAGNNLNIEFIDPSDDPDLKQKLQRLGIPELQLRVIEKDQQQIRKAYIGISIQYADKSEVIPMIKNIDNLEYDLTSAIFKVTDTEERTVGWIGAREQEDSSNGFGQIQKILDEEYMVRNIELDKTGSVPKNLKALIVEGNQTLSERGKFAIDQYLMDGGKVIFLADGITLGEGTLAASESRQGIMDLLEHYGFGLLPELVLDVSKANAAFNSGFMRFSMPYPFWPRIRTENFNQQDPIVNQLESLVLPWVSPINILNENNTSYKIDPLFTTTENAWTVKAPFDLNPQQRFSAQPEDLSKKTLAVKATGKFKSYFEGKPIPQKEQNPEAGPPDKEEKIVPESKETSLIFIPNTRFINNQFGQMFPENIIFMQNLIDSFVIGDKLIGIRSRAATSRDLDYRTTDEQQIESKKSAHRMIGTFSVPVVIVLFGLSRISLRRKHKAQLATQSKLK
jgi:ABC-2 type transport system permease protein